MIDTFLQALNPVLMLFCFIVIGFTLNKLKILPENTGAVLAKLETWVFCPALSFYAMAQFCTVENLGKNGTFLLLSTIGVFVAVALGLLCSPLFTKKNTYERNIYKYALTFANSGYFGDPLVQAILGDAGLAYFKIYCLPVSIATYTYGVCTLIPKSKQTGRNPLKELINPIMMATLAGIIVGVVGIGNFLTGSASQPTFFGNVLIALKSCLGPVAMILAGFVIAKYDFYVLVKTVKVYVATFLRLVVLPIIIVSCLFLVKELSNLAFNLSIDNFVLHLAFFAVGSPLGLNTVIFPAAYGGDSKTGASMTMISHTLCVITVPIMYALVCAVFPV